MTAAGRVSVLGVRHFGPGSARATLAALERIDPDCVLVEGPADADGIIHWAGAAGMAPPVALLGYEVAHPGNASFWPMAAFCPEWQAITWALARRVPVRFLDLPSRVTLAHHQRPAVPAESRAAGAESRAAGAEPLALVASAAGHDDVDSWWDHLIESRGGLRLEDGNADPLAAFEALTATMAELRSATVPEPDARDADRGVHEARREAHMRTVLRTSLADGARRVAVVCGAWHAPALTDPLPPASADAALLRRMPTVRSHIAWVPWSHERLRSAGGYGAGIASPGWYHHVFSTSDHVSERWLTRVAAALRARDLPVSTASIIDATRLAETLADLRRRPSVGLAEVHQATVAVLCDGDPDLAAYVTSDVVVGHALGTVPETAPAPPLELDLAATAKRLRLPRKPTTRELLLDLRRPTDLARSHLLHRLAALGIPWGARRETTGLGTFKEGWALRWRPELSVDVVMAATYGPTVADATAAYLTRRAGQASTLAEVTSVLETVLVADLPSQVPGILQRLTDRAAAEQDVVALLAAIPALARALRYGDVRDTDTHALGATASSLLDRAMAGLPGAVGGIDDDLARRLRDHLDRVEEAVSWLGPDTRDRWWDRLGVIARADRTHPLLAGRALRILHAAGRLDPTHAATSLAAALSRGARATDQSAWVEGFLAGEGLLLAFDDTLLRILDAWVVRLDDDAFMATLPVLRRTFGSYAVPERRAVADQVRRLRACATQVQAGDPSAGLAGFDPELAAGPEATMTFLLGLS
ncbi:MAG: hypothetical protein IPI32_01055 [Austwickia sp.]|nr:hypothetical protein [Austwickia sp.]MBK9102815.1 hypothetical protein [Austwickia sp.]